MTAPDRFEDRLLAELRHVVAANPAPAAAAGRPRTRQRFVLAGGGVAAATAAAVLVAAGGDRPTAAYAVSQRADGMVTVEITSLRDAAGLERALRAKGVPAEVDYSPTAACPDAGMPAPPPPGAAAEKHTVVRGESAGPGLSSSGGPAPAGAERHAMRGQIRIGPDGIATFGIDPGDLEPGQKVWITTSGPTASSVAMGVGAERPAAPPCKPAP